MITNLDSKAGIVRPACKAISWLKVGKGVSAARFDGPGALILYRLEGFRSDDFFVSKGYVYQNAGGTICENLFSLIKLFQIVISTCEDFHKIFN